jgi:hypothetical protein
MWDYSRVKKRRLSALVLRISLAHALEESERLLHRSYRWEGPGGDILVLLQDNSPFPR